MHGGVNSGWMMVLCRASCASSSSWLSNIYVFIRTSSSLHFIFLRYFALTITFAHCLMASRIRWPNNCVGCRVTCERADRAECVQRLSIAHGWGLYCHIYDPLVLGERIAAIQIERRHRPCSVSYTHLTLPTKA